MSGSLPCGAALATPKTEREKHRELLLKSLGLTEKAPAGRAGRDKYCQHTGWWVRMLQPTVPCPDCKKMLPPEFR